MKRYKSLERLTVTESMQTKWSSLKNHKSKRFFTWIFLLMLSLFCVIFNSCKKDDQYGYIDDYYMNQSTLLLNVGEHQGIYVTSSSSMPSGDGTSWDWKSSNPSVAILQDGCCLSDKYVYAVGKGTATITCTISNENGMVLKTLSCEVTVSNVNQNQNTVTIKGKVTDCKNNPVSNVKVTIELSNGSNYTSVSTNSTGDYTVQIQSNTPVIVSIKSKDYNNYSPEISYSISGKAGNITVTQNFSIPCINGTQENPYIIRTATDLDNMRNHLSAYHKLGNDIDLKSYLAPGGAGYAKWGADGWLPIGRYSSELQFTGSLDGAGYKITGLWMTPSGLSPAYIGLFGYLNNAKVSNLGLEIASGGITGANRVGGLAGWIDNNSSITNCYVIGGNVYGTFMDVGGLVGYVGAGSSITNCYATVNVIGSTAAGGIVGGIGDNKSNVSNCYATGEVSAYQTAGGIAGYAENNTISNCVALNPSISTNTSNGSLASARIVSGRRGTLSFINNWARNDMKVNSWGSPPLIKGSTQCDGGDCAAIPTISWWTTSAPNGPGWSSTIWYFTNGQLPKLR